MIGGFRSDLSITLTRKADGNFGNVSAGVRVTTKTVVKLQYGSTKLVSRYIHCGSCRNTHAFGLRIWIAIILFKGQTTNTVCGSFLSVDEATAKSSKIRLLLYPVGRTASTSSWLSKYSTALRWSGFNCSLNFK